MKHEGDQRCVHCWYQKESWLDIAIINWHWNSQLIIEYRAKMAQTPHKKTSNGFINNCYLHHFRVVKSGRRGSKSTLKCANAQWLTEHLFCFMTIVEIVSSPVWKVNLTKLRLFWCRPGLSYLAQSPRKRTFKIRIL